MRLTHYKDLGYSTIFNPKTGFFARIEDKGKTEPFWSPHGPELLDISITNWCDNNCSFCYRSSNQNGHHMALSNYKKIIDRAAEIGVLQVALGGGNPNQHPDFIKILQYTKDSGIVPNFTTNGIGLSGTIISVAQECCGAIAVSAYSPYTEMRNAITELLTVKIKVNIHFILDSTSIKTAINWLTKPPDFLSGVNALVFLNYKPTGREIFKERLLNKSPLLQEFFELATTGKHSFKIGFDSCSVSGIFARTNTSSILVEGCDAGRFSMFISEDLKAYPCSFQKTIHAGDSLDENGDFLGIWHTSENFKSFRNYFSSDTCSGCSSQKSCLNGCPLFNNIVLCGK